MPYFLPLHPGLTRVTQSLQFIMSLRLNLGRKVEAAYSNHVTTAVCGKQAVGITMGSAVNISGKVPMTGSHSVLKKLDLIPIKVLNTA